MLLIRPVPRVRFMNSFWKPIRPRAGMRYSRRTRPMPSGSMLTSSALRSPSACITPPWCWSSTSAVTSSIGSCRSPSCLVEHDARLATRPARSLRGACSRAGSSGAARRGPRPRRRRPRRSRCTRSATLLCSSRSSRSRIWRLVTNLPSRPASGELLTQKFIVSVGSSTFSIGSGCGSSRSVSVTPMPMSSMPLISTMSPGPASVACLRSRPSNFSTWLTRALSGVLSGPLVARPRPARLRACPG